VVGEWGGGGKSDAQESEEKVGEVHFGD